MTILTAVADTGERQLNFTDGGIHGGGKPFQDVRRRSAYDVTGLPPLNARHGHVDTIRELPRRQPCQYAQAAKAGPLTVRGQQVAKLHVKGCRQPAQYRRAGRRGAELPSGDALTTRNADQSGQLVLREPSFDASCP